MLVPFLPTPGSGQDDPGPELHHKHRMGASFIQRQYLAVLLTAGDPFCVFAMLPAHERPSAERDNVLCALREDGGALARVHPLGVRWHNAPLLSPARTPFGPKPGK